jgi:hypothetical protein
MKKLMKKSVLFAAAAGLSMMFIAQANADESAVSGTVAEVYQVNGLDAIGITPDPAAAASSNDTVCIYSNAGNTGTYQVTFTSDKGGADDVFRMETDDGATADEQITYVVTYNDESSSGGTAPSEGVALTSQTSAGGVVAGNYDACGTANGNVQISIPAANVQGKVAGQYSDTLTMTIAADE